MDCLEHSAKEVDATREDPLEVAYGEKFQRQYLKSITKGGFGRFHHGAGYFLEVVNVFSCVCMPWNDQEGRKRRRRPTTSIKFGTRKNSASGCNPKHPAQQRSKRR